MNTLTAVLAATGIAFSIIIVADMLLGAIIGQPGVVQMSYTEFQRIY